MISRRGLDLFAMGLLSACGSWMLAGCGGGQPPGPDTTDAGMIATEVRGVADRARDAKAFRQMFADGAAPPDAARKQIAKYQIEPVGSPSVRGETASVEVNFYDDRAGKDMGRATWTFVKQGDQWKLKTAPLP